MIVTVTMNPAIDKTLDIENLEAGAVHRVKKLVMDAGGKGINVSKCVHALGGETVATGFVGGLAGKMIETALTEMGIIHSFVPIDGETRTNVKVVDLKNEGSVTEFNEPGPEITKANMDALQKKLENLAGPSTIFTFSGSVPASVDPEIYGYFTKRLSKKQATVFVDASGPLLAEAIKAKPFLVKPNVRELCKCFAVPRGATEEQLIELGQRVLDMGVNTCVISRGHSGAIFMDHYQTFKTNGIQVHSHSTVGAGDAMLGALAYGLDMDLPYEECATLAIATSAGACTTLGTKPPSRGLVDELVKEVFITKIK